MQDMQTDEKFVGGTKIPNDFGGGGLFFGQNFHEVPLLFFRLSRFWRDKSDREEFFATDCADFH
jgi:hypothetical protein